MDQNVKILYVDDEVNNLQSFRVIFEGILPYLPLNQHMKV